MSKKGKGKGKDLKHLKSKGKAGKPKPNYNVAKPVDETTKQFYLWQIHTLEEKNSKFQKLLDDLTVNETKRHDQILQKLKDKEDMNGYLKAELQKKVDAFNDLNDKYLTCVQLLDTERYTCTMNLQKLRKETDDAYALLYAENVKLVSKLRSLEEFFANKASITKRLEEAESTIVRLEAEHKTTVLEMEKKFIIGKQKLKGEMITRIEKVAAEFRKYTKKNQSTTFMKTSAENSALRSKLSSVSDKVEQLIKENEHLSESLHKANQAKEFADSDTKILFGRYDICLEALQACKLKLSDAKHELNQVPLDYDDFEKVIKDNTRLERELSETKLKLTDISVKFDLLSKKCLHQELLSVLDSKKKLQLEGMLSNAIAAIREAVTSLVPKKDADDFSKQRRRSTKSTIKHLPDRIIEELADDNAIEIGLSGSTHFPGYVFKSKPQSTASLLPIRSPVPPGSEQGESGNRTPPSSNDHQQDHLTTRLKLESEKVQAPKIHFLGPHGSNLDVDSESVSKASSHLLFPAQSALSHSIPPSGSRSSRIIHQPRSTLNTVAVSDIHIPPKWTKSQGDRFTQNLMQALELRQPRELRKTLAPSMSLEELVPIQNKILESLAIVVKSAMDLGVQLPTGHQEETMRKSHVISFVPDLPNFSRKSSEILRSRSASKTMMHYDSTSPSPKQSHSPTLEDVDATTALNLRKLRDTLCQGFKPIRTFDSNVQVYTKEDMLEYLLVLLDSASHLGAGVQQAQLNVLWQHATGETSAPKMGFVKRPHAHYQPGDLGIIPRGKAHGLQHRRKLKRIKCRDDPARHLNVDDKAVQTLTVPQMIANYTEEEKNTLRSEKWSNQKVEGLANNRTSYDDDCCNKIPVCPAQTT